MRFTCKTFKRSLRSKRKSKFRANNTRRRRCLFRKKIRYMRGGNAVDGRIVFEKNPDAVLANPLDWDNKKENVSTL